MKKKHKLSAKLREERKMMSNQEKIDRVPPFLCKAWLAKKDAIAFKVEQRQAKSHNRALARKALKI